jgi:H+/Cl- antiporter ClcA
LLFLSIVISLAVQLFQISLERAVSAHTDHPFLVWLLPLAWIFFWLTSLPQSWRDFETTDQILREVPSPHRPISSWLAPLIWIRTLWSHLFGASVGREGTALQIAGSLSDFAARGTGLTSEDRTALLRAALAAGLTSAYRTPWAAFIFAIELGGVTDRRERFEALAAAWISFGVTQLRFFPNMLELPQIDFLWEVAADLRFWLLSLGLICVAPLYRLLYLGLNRLFRKTTYPARWAIGGAAGCTLLLLWHADPIRNLGTIMIEGAFSDAPASWLFLKKAIVTAVFCATGWFGGDFTPNMAIGAAAGSTLSTWAGFPLPVLGAALGLFLPIAFMHRILATGWVMTLEYFGWKVAVLAIPAFIGAWLLHELLEAKLFAKLRHPHSKSH